MCGCKSEAVKDLNKVNYPDSIINMAKKYLDAVSKNGILFTYGDNDTYPLWYLQEYKNYRNDILVLNTSLLGLRRYIKMLEIGYDGKLFATLSSKYYKNNFEYFVRSTTSKNQRSVSLQSFIDNINTYKSNTEVTNGQSYKGETIIQYNNENLFYHNNKVLKIKLRNYIYLNEFMMLDIINSNKHRALYFTSDDIFLEKMLLKKGTVYQLRNK